MKLYYRCEIRGDLAMKKSEYEKYSGKYDRYSGIEQQTDNKFLNLYHINALTKSAKPFDYYMASRNSIENIKPVSHKNSPEGMAVFATVKSDAEEERVVLIRQYRYPLDSYLYELPAGLIEEGESPEAAAVREMKEETGLTLNVTEDSYYDILAKNPFYLAQGLTDESGVIVCGTATGDVAYDEQEDSEDIKVCFVTKEEAEKLLQTEPFSMRAGLMLWSWISK